MHACRAQLDTKLGLGPLTSVLCGPTPRELWGSLNCTTSKSTTTFEESRQSERKSQGTLSALHLCFSQMVTRLDSGRWPAPPSVER